MKELIRIRVEVTKLSFWKSLKVSTRGILSGRLRWINEEIRHIPLRPDEEGYTEAQIEITWIAHHRAIYIPPEWANKHGQ